MKTPNHADPCPCGSGMTYEQCCAQRKRTPTPGDRSALAVADIPNVIQSALDHHRAGRLPYAKAIYQQVLQVAPAHDTALHLLGLISNQEGEYDRAVELMSRSIQSSPGNPVYHFNLGAVYNTLNKPDEAIACYRKALALKPDDVETLNNLGNSLKERGQPDEAIACYRKSLTYRPNDAMTLNNLGIALKGQGKLDEAVACYQQSLAIKPDDAGVIKNMGNALKEQGRIDEAMACYQRSLAVRGDDAEIHNSLGAIFTEQGKLDDALTCFRQSLAIKPEYTDAHNNAGHTLKGLGKADEALACYQQAIAIRPDYVMAYNNKLMAAHYTNLYSPDALFAEYLKFAAQFETPLKKSWRPHSNSRDPEKRLKIGYVSPDFCNHALAYFIDPIIANHGKTQVEVFCYHTHILHDNLTSRLMAEADHWLQCNGISDEQLAERIRADGIDILVDLAGHTGGNRLLVFARKPAPVQVTYLGYIHTTGLSAIDYRLTHVDADPPGSERYYSETLYRLPGNFWWCYRPRPDMPEVAPPPALVNGFVTFGSTNNFAKLSPETLTAWAEILRTVPTARLLIAGVPEGSAQQTLTKWFTTQGIAKHRLLIYGRLSSIAFWALHSQIDIVLDPFPHSGGTTTCDALWLGVPVVTLTGQVLVSRMGYALLKNLNLPDLAAETVQDYVSIAAGLACNPARLEILRSGMRVRLAASPLRDEAGFTRTLESAYREMWRKYCTQ